MAKHNITTKTGRGKLLPRREPYWHPVKKGLYVGFRKGPNTWIARLQVGTEKTTHALNIPVDVDEKGIYDVAVDEARKWASVQHHSIRSGVDITTVSDACNWYVNAKLSNKNTAADTKKRFDRLIHKNSLGRIRLEHLTMPRLMKWIDDQIGDEHTGDAYTRRCVSVRRDARLLVAALNFARIARPEISDTAWKKDLFKTKHFNKLKAGKRELTLTVEERNRLIAACSPALGNLVKAIALTGARPGEMAKAKVSDFNASEGKLALSGKTGTRKIHVSSACRAFLVEMSKNKLPSAPLIADPKGNEWNRDKWKHPFKAAVKEAGLPTAVVLYTLRHSYISDAIRTIDVYTVAELCGTSIKMIEEHYGHIDKENIVDHLDRVAAL